MSQTSIEQTPGWWPNLVQAACEDCGWHGPTRDLNKPNQEVLAKLDRDEHKCDS